MNLMRAFVSGLKTVWRMPALLVWLYLAGLAVSLPFAGAMRTILRDAIGSSLVHENLERGFDTAWYGEFRYSATGLASTFGPSSVGILAPLANLERLLDGDILRQNGIILAAGALFLLAWSLLGGGVIGCYTGKIEPYSRSQFFSYGGEYFLRFVRLLVLSLLVYIGIFRWVARPLHRWMEEWTRDVTVERTVILGTVAVYALAGLLLAVASCAFDYAKIALVAERRRSSVLALLKGLSFVLSRPVRTLGLYLALILVGVILLFLYSLIAPGPGQSGAATLILAFLVSQLFVLARLALKLWFLASQADFYLSVAPVTSPISPPGAS